MMGCMRVKGEVHRNFWVATSILTNGRLIPVEDIHARVHRDLIE
jgi:hypothetical protein